MPAFASSTTSSDNPQHLDPEYEPLNVDSESLTAERIDMGFDEQFVKPEGRQGDVAAQWTAYVRRSP